MSNGWSALRGQTESAYMKFDHTDGDHLGHTVTQKLHSCGIVADRAMTESLRLLHRVGSRRFGRLLSNRTRYRLNRLPDISDGTSGVIHNQAHSWNC